MEFRFEFKNNPEHVLVQVAGESVKDEWGELSRQLFSHPEWRSSLDRIFDLRQLDFAKLSNEEVNKVLAVFEQQRQNISGSKAAIIVDDSLAFGMVRMYELLGGGRMHKDFRVFYNPEEAEKWLHAVDDE